MMFFLYFPRSFGDEMLLNFSVFSVIIIELVFHIITDHLLKLQHKIHFHIQFITDVAGRNRPIYMKFTIIITKCN